MLRAGRGAQRVLLFVAGACATFGVSGASALPGVGRAPRLPVRGPSVSLGCATPVSGGVHCFGQAIRPAKQDGPELMAGPTGLGPTQIQSAYKLAGLNASGRTVAIVDAFNDPKAASDLATFRKAYGLPACTTANGCFKQVNQNGATSPLPSGDYGWAEEESLDLDAVSSACPTCHILLVEASSASTSALSKAENSAAKAAGVAAISNSYGGSEASSETSTDSVLQPSRARHHRQLGRRWLRRGVPGGFAVRDRRGRHDADPGVQLPGLDGERMVGRRQRLLVV